MTSTTSNVIPPIGYKLQLKRLIVNEFRNYLYNISVSNTMNQVNCTIEYPNTPEKYPALIVGYREKRVHNAGVGHIEESPNLSTERWTFTGDVTVEIMALTSLERDFISDHVVALYAFGSFLQIPFESDVMADNTIDVQVNTKILTPLGEETRAGVTWGVTDTRIYTCGYTFPIFGAFSSNPIYADYIQKVTTTSTNSNIFNALPSDIEVVPPTLA